MAPLTMPSAETKLSGVYQLVAANKAGSVEREVKLEVGKEGAGPADEEPSYESVPLTGPHPCCHILVIMCPTDIPRTTNHSRMSTRWVYEYC